MPERIQRRRTRGWRMPAGAVYVGRPSEWGNPFSVAVYGVQGAVDLFRARLAERPELAERARAVLRGRDLACWCPTSAPCHADVLLEVANEATVTAGRWP